MDDQEPLRGNALLVAATNKCIQEPECYDQTSYHSDCGTTHCWGGHIQILGGRPMYSDCVEGDVAELTGMPEELAFYCCRTSRSLLQIRNAVHEYIHGELTVESIPLLSLTEGDTNG